MMRIFLIIMISAMLVWAGDSESRHSLSIGYSPSRGLASYEFYHGTSKFSAALAFAGASEESYTGTVLDLALTFGYHPWGADGFFIQSSHHWLRTVGDDPKVAWTYADGSTQTVSYPKVNVWEVLTGVGYQRAFWGHLLVFADVGIPFYAGQGGYYLQYDSGRLSNDGIEFAFGGGLGYRF